MRFLTVRELRTKSAEIWERLSRERELVVTSNGKPIAILSSVNEGNLEESLAAIRKALATMAVASLQNSSVAEGKDRFSPEEIRAEIRASRKKRAW